MNKNILFPIADGTEEAEAVIAIDLLRRAKCNVIVAGTSDNITTSHNIRIIPDELLKNIHKSFKFDAVVLPGGLKGVHIFLEDEHLIDLVKFNYSQKHLIAAICAAPLVLKKAKIVNGNCSYTCHPSIEKEINLAQFISEPVVVDKNVITSRGVGTAIDFSLAIIEYLYGTATSNKIAQEIVFA